MVRGRNRRVNGRWTLTSRPSPSTIQAVRILQYRGRVVADELLLRELRAYVRKWGRRDPTRALASWVGQEGLIIGTGTAACSRRWCLWKPLAPSGRFQYWATEWFFPAFAE